jgi:hypothetical protein
LAALCGIARLESWRGDAIFNCSGEVLVGENRTVYSYLDYWGRCGVSASREGWKLIQPLTESFGNHPELFRYREDTGEAIDLRAAHPIRTGWLEGQIRRALEVKGVAEKALLNIETQDQLRALGYLE